mmetsp:Transcript_23978/g.50534  ORF Transcript_23978/g.50534 Transcript_23978/m.50534 type:complete len:254 (-) Transcript_23978:460-1221(-)
MPDLLTVDEIFIEMEQRRRLLRGGSNNGNAADGESSMISSTSFAAHRARRLEDVDYWRKRAGWADDDETMKSYNQGVYNTYYVGDDATSSGGSSSGESGGSIGSRAKSGMAGSTGIIIGLTASVVFMILLFKCCSTPDKPHKSKSPSAKTRDSSRSLRDKHADRRSRSRSRARSKSRTRSKSRRREKERDDDAGSDYKLMDGDGDGDDQSKRSKKSSRSRSRSKARSKSKTRDEKRERRKSGEEEPKRETMLV